ncbi:hypothetical protein ABES02_28230 [Neobacillus pocheonensis]|uniref:hypothetical protein n=1 Tax=Neobacillus pocheonensis TaxID=363869 RepID=UPI003D2D1625
MKSSNYLSIEMQSGTEKLAEALVLRGFPVEVNNDFISLRNGSQHDQQQLKTFLDTLEIPVFWNGDGFQLLVNHFPIPKMRKIIQYPGREHMVNMEGYHFQWRSFVTRRYGIRTNTIELCPYTAILVKALNEAGIVTLTGCNGHGQHDPNFQLSGIYHGIWFSIIQQRYLKDLPLHYQWDMQFIRGGCNAGIFAQKSSDDRWDMNKVLADCYQMAQMLTSHAAEIRAWKRRTFKRNMKQSAEAMKKGGNIHQLFEWMIEAAELTK